MKNQVVEVEAATRERVTMSGQQLISKLEDQLYKTQEELKRATAEMMKATEKAAYYKNIITKIID